jgi:pimeloyl-ACP methyl ester carboxylesterase
MAPWVLPRYPRLARVVGWLLGPYIAGRPKDLRVLAIDADSDETHDATGHLAAIRCPTLVVGGEFDTAYPPALVREFVAGIPDARHVEYAGSGHGGPGARFAEDACAFLSEASTPATVVSQSP